MEDQDQQDGGEGPQGAAESPQHAAQSALKLGAIPGATPDKWVSRWRDRYPDFRLSVDYYDDAGQLTRLQHGTADVGYIRLREGEPDVDKDLFSRVLLYREEPVVCAAQEHWIAAAEESVTWEEIAEEPFLDPAEMTPGQEPDPHEPLAGGELARAERIALEVVASGAGLLILPNSVARMLSRKDIVIRRVEDIPGYEVGLGWLKEKDSHLIQEFIGVARGRKPGSGRSAITPAAEGSATHGGKGSGKRGSGKGSVKNTGAKSGATSRTSQQKPRGKSSGPARSGRGPSSPKARRRR